MLNAGIHAAFSTNCIADVVVSKPVTSGIATISPSSAPASAVQRASAALRSEPVASTTTPARIGTQMTRERIDCPNMGMILVEPREPRHQGKHPDQHGKRVVVDVARLEGLDQAREAFDQVRRAVDEEAVDHILVAAPPQAAAECARPPGEYPAVEFVEPVFVEQHLMQELEALCNGGRVPIPRMRNSSSAPATWDGRTR